MTLSYAEELPCDIVVFAPYPVQEVLLYSQALNQAPKSQKRIKTIFLSNSGGSFSENDNPVNAPAVEICAADRIVPTEEYRKAMARLISQINLPQEDLISLGYPHKALTHIWEGGDELFKQEMLGIDLSEFFMPWGSFKTGYTRKDLIQDIKDIVKQYQPQVICIPSPLDINSEYQSTAKFVNKALDEIAREESPDRLDRVSLRYYAVRQPPGLTYLNQFDNGNEQKGYRSPENNSRDVLPVRNVYLNNFFNEWQWVSQVMKRSGYNINLGVVADVAGDIDDRDIYLVKQERIFSDNQKVVLDLTSKMIDAMVSGKITPVVKHFPGLGSVRENTHTWLPKTVICKDKFYERDLFPFRGLIKRGQPFWIMTSHAIYPNFDDKPAVISRKIQTDLLRNDLGFKGIIISDELLGMQAIEEYAASQHIPKPYIGEIAVLAFMAGTDILLIYPDPGKEEETILAVVTAVRKAVADKRITEKEIDGSVLRILREKERIFNKPLSALIKTLSLERKICQKIIIDVKDDQPLVNAYGLSGVEARDYRVIDKLQKDAKIPLFIAGQHEGGQVFEPALNIRTYSAYLIGMEFERTFARKKGGYSDRQKPGNQDRYSLADKEPFFNFNQLNKKDRDDMVNILSGSLDCYIRFFAEFKEKPLLLADPSFRGPLILNMSQKDKIALKQFADLPVVWLRNFSDKSTALCAYNLLKESFIECSEKEPAGSAARSYAPGQPDEIIFRLNHLKELLKKANDQKNSKNMRVLCLAAHPDDEDAQALIYFKEKFNADTYILLATRGQAGENEIGPQLYEDLGVLRTEEIERSAEMLGVKKIYYLGKDDSGYCLDPSNALDKWGKQDTLRDLVYFYRLIQPDIIVTKHNILSGHCDHRAFALLAQEAFDISGNSRVYPELSANGLLIWQPARFYQRLMNKNKDYPLADLVVDNQTLCDIGGKTYGQVASEALSQHQSQGLISGCGINGEIEYELVKTQAVPGQRPALSLDEEKKAVFSGFPGVRIIPGLRLGLFEEKSNVFFIALKTLGCDFEKIGVKSIVEGDLSRFDTIVVTKGLRDILSLPNGGYKRLLEFAEKGGNLVVFLQDRTASRLPIVPYDLKVALRPVFDENSPVRILLPRHPLFNYPNKINTQDFNGWEQYRGIFFPAVYSDKYAELTSVTDNEMKAIKSGYLSAEYGRGSYILTTYAWFRQLRKFNSGAYKNLANIISYHYTKEAPVRK